MSPQASEEVMSSASSATLIDQQQTVGLSSAVEDQLRGQIAGLEDQIRQLKLNPDPNREGMKQRVLQEELSQLHEKNLNLRVELQVAQEGHRLLEEKYHTLENEHERCKKLMQKAVENLSTGLDPSNGDSANLGLTIEGAAPRPPAEKDSGSPNAVQIGEETRPSGFPLDSTIGGSPVQANLFGQPSVRSPAQPLHSMSGAFQNNQPHTPKSPFPSSASGPRPFNFLTTPSLAFGAAAGSLGPLQVKKPILPMFGDPEEGIQYKANCEKNSNAAPGYWTVQQQNFEAASRRGYDLYNGEIKPRATPKSTEPLLKIRTSSKLGDSSSSSPDQESSQQSKKRKIGEQGGW